MARERGSPEKYQITFITVEDVLENRDLGYTAGTEEDGYHAYGPPLPDEDKFQKLTVEPVETEDMALKIIVDYVNETILGVRDNEA